VLPPADQVELWALDLARPPRDAGVLLPSEELRLAEQRGATWLHARAGLRAVLARHLGEPPDELRFDERGKPRLEPPSPLRFSLSHSGDVGLLAVATEREVGVDVEEVRPRRDVGRRAFTNAERAAVAEADDNTLALHRHWVAKEAFTKASGRGVVSMRSFEVSLDGPGGTRLVHVGGDTQEASRWSLHMLDVAEPYVAALAVEGDARVAPLRPFEP
jgi:4'-phosphopantetheinyl transferase